MSKRPRDPKLLYVSSDYTLEQVAEKLAGQKGCSLDNLKKRSKTEGWSKLREDYKTEKASRLARRLEQNAAKAKAEASAPVPSTGAASGTGTPTTTAPNPAAPHGPTEAPTAPSRLQESPLFRAAAKLADKEAEQRAKELEQLGEVRRQGIAGCQLLMNQAVSFLAANGVRLRPTGKTLGDGSPELVAEQTRKMTFAKRQQAGRMMAEAAQTAKLLTTFDPTGDAQRLALQLLSMQKQVELIQARIDGTLPPEKHEIVEPGTEDFTQMLRRELGTERRYHARAAVAAGGGDDGPAGPN